MYVLANPLEITNKILDIVSHRFLHQRYMVMQDVFRYSSADRQPFWHCIASQRT